jgi:hypothetical protein
MTKREVLIELLGRYTAALEGSPAHGRGDQHGSRLNLPDQELWCEAFIELDRCLMLMRKEGRQKSVRYRRIGGNHDGRTETCSLATARWHLFEWWVDVPYVLSPKRRRAKNGRTVTVLEPAPKHHPEAREDRAMAGLDWLCAAYDFRRAYPGLHYLAKQQIIPGFRAEAIAA